MNLTETLMLAIKLHDGQYRKGSHDPYVFHPIRVAEQFVDPAYKKIALLHDVIEDCTYFEHLIDRGVETEVATAVQFLSKQHGESYIEFIERVSKAQNKILIEIKIADIKDNLADDPSPEQIEKYKAALKVLQP